MAVHAIAVIGAGAMGSGIAQVAAVAGLGVTLIEVSDAAVEKGLDRVRGNLQKLVAKGKMTQADKEAALGSIRGTAASPASLAECALRRQTPEVGAECPNWARSDLCGLRLVSAWNSVACDGDRGKA